MISVAFKASDLKRGGGGRERERTMKSLPGKRGRLTCIQGREDGWILVVGSACPVSTMDPRDETDTQKRRI